MANIINVLWDTIIATAVWIWLVTSSPEVTNQQKLVREDVGIQLASLSTEDGLPSVIWDNTMLTKKWIKTDEWLISVEENNLDNLINKSDESSLAIVKDWIDNPELYSENNIRILAGLYLEIKSINQEAEDDDDIMFVIMNYWTALLKIQDNKWNYIWNDTLTDAKDSFDIAEIEKPKMMESIDKYILEKIIKIDTILKSGRSIINNKKQGELNLLDKEIELQGEKGLALTTKLNEQRERTQNAVIYSKDIRTILNAYEAIKKI